MPVFPGSQDPLNTPTVPSPLPGVHEHACTSLLYSSKASNNLSNNTSYVFPQPMPLHLLEKITDGFSKDRQLGSGAYGKVYKGVHKSGETIAVKLLHSKPGFDDAQFEKEFRNVVSLHHENIVRLVGFCHETRREFVLHNGTMIFADSTRMALCFEYMQNGSLDNYLFDECSGHDWPTRYAIIKGICEGLKYLHEELEPPLYHLDLKPANILLDHNMMPKLADFGVSRFLRQEQTQIKETCIGTLGYIPPEYIERNIISNKFDIFSLGVVIIKLIAGATGYTQCAEMPSEQFIELVHERWRNRLQATSEDGNEQYSKQLMRCIEMALSCVEKEWHKRPLIGDIVDKLNEMDTKEDQGSSDQIVSVDIYSTPSQTSLPPASVETTNTKGGTRPREHARMAGFSKSSKSLVLLFMTKAQSMITKAQSTIEKEAKLRQRAQADIAFISGELRVIQSILYSADKGKLVQNLVVRTWVSKVRELANQVEEISFLRELGNERRVTRVERLPDGSVILGSGRPRKDFLPDGRRRTRKEMLPSTGRRRSPACLHAWRCQQPR